MLADKQPSRAGALSADDLFHTIIVGGCDSGLAVAEHARGHGIGETLLRRAVRTYFQLGWLLTYGQIPNGAGLESYYTRQGFTVLPDGEGIELDRITVPVRIGQIPGERLFARWRSH